jgi:dihydroorotate dehydrogenase electron transfer subunit
MEACIICPDGAIPSAGQYLLAIDLDDPDAILSIPLFPIEQSDQGFWAAPLFPAKWEPGTKLDLIGPLGHGFGLPHNIQRLGLVALGETVSRLLPLVNLITRTHAGMTLFTDLTLPMLPAALEVSPLASLKDSLDWPDFMALDVPMERLPELRARLGLPDRAGLACPAQVLVTTSLPCAGMAQCGACAVPAMRGWKLVCEDGPVFDLNLLKW